MPDKPNDKPESKPEVAPVPVEIKTPSPVPVEIVGPIPQLPHVEVKAPSVTTPEEDRTTASQRRVNIIWEVTQAGIAIVVIGTGMLVAAILSLSIGDADNRASAVAAFVFLTGSVNLVIGFYFGRTNHQRTGGVKVPDKEPSRGT